MPNHLALGIDVGTQGAKALVVDTTTNSIVARAAHHYDLIPDLPPGAAEQHPDTWTDAVKTLIADLANQGVPIGDVACVGVSGQQHGLVLLDDGGTPVRPAKLWCDTSTTAEAEQLSRAFDAPVPVGFTASKIRWVQQHEPHHWARTATVMLPHDYINFRLTGRRTMEVGDASGTAFLDIASRTFDQRRVSAIGNGLADRLPELIDAPNPAGTISADGAAWSGLSEGTTVSAGGGDNMMSAIGSGTTAPGVLTISLGTSATAFAHSDHPVIDPDGLIAPFCASCPGWLPLLCTMNATAVVDEVRTAFNTTHDELTRAAAELPPGTDGLTLIPFLIGERVPDLPHATGTLHGIRPGWLSPPRLYRAAIEGVTANLASGINRLRALNVPLTDVRLVGGGAPNPLWRQILADMLNLPVTPLAEPESAALGATIQAIWTHTGTPLNQLTQSRLTRADTITPSPNATTYTNFITNFERTIADL